MCHPVPHNLRRDGVIIVSHPDIRRGHHLRQGWQPRQHHIRCHAIVDQAGHFTHPDPLQLLNPCQGIINRAKQPRILKIPPEREIEDRIHLGHIQRPDVDIHRFHHTRRFLERRKRPSILLDQRRGRPQVILHRPAHQVAHLFAVLPHKRVQHQRHHMPRRIVPRIPQCLMIQDNLRAHLIDRLPQQMRQHIRANRPGLAPGLGIARRGHPQRQFLGHRTRLGFDAETAVLGQKIDRLTAPQPAHLIGGLEHRGLIGGRCILRPQHEIIRMPARRHSNARPPVRQVINHRPLLGNPRRMVQRHHTRPRPHADIPRHRRHRSPRHRRVRIGPAKGMEMPLGRPDRAKAMSIGELCPLQQQLVFLRPRPVVIAPIVKREFHSLRRSNAPRRHQRPLLIAAQNHLEPTRQSPEQLQHRNVER